MTAGVAIVGASVIAVTPIAPPPNLEARSPQISSAAVELTAASYVDVDPIAYWGEVLATTQANVTALVGAASADPFPVLNQVIANQAGYANTIGTALSSGGASFFEWATTEGNGTLPTLLKEAGAALAQGNVKLAASRIQYALTTVGVALVPMLPLLALPYQMAQSVANVFQTLVATSLYSPGALGKTVLGLMNVVGTGVSALGTIGQAVVDAANAGDAATALNAIVNSPAYLADSLLNGELIERPGRPPLRTAGILSLTLNPTNVSWGPLSALFINIPRTIAAAITPPTGPAAVTSAELAGTATVDVAMLPITHTDMETTPGTGASTGTLKELTSGSTDAVNGITSAVTAAFNGAKSVTLKVDPQPELRETATVADTPAADTTAGSTDDSASAGTEESTDAPKVKADKESKREARKEAREAKRQERQEARAERQQARQEAKKEAKADKQTAKPDKSTGGKHRADRASDK